MDKCVCLWVESTNFSLFFGWNFIAKNGQKCVILCTNWKLISTHNFQSNEIKLIFKCSRHRWESRIFIKMVFVWAYFDSFGRSKHTGTDSCVFSRIFRLIKYSFWYVRAAWIRKKFCNKLMNFSVECYIVLSQNKEKLFVMILCVVSILTFHYFPFYHKNYILFIFGSLSNLIFHTKCSFVFIRRRKTAIAFACCSNVNQNDLFPAFSLLQRKKNWKIIIQQSNIKAIDESRRITPSKNVKMNAKHLSTKFLFVLVVLLFSLSISFAMQTSRTFKCSMFMICILIGNYILSSDERKKWNIKMQWKMSIGNVAMHAFFISLELWIVALMKANGHTSHTRKIFY